MYYTYILFSRSKHKFYFGSAKDLHERLRLHNGGNVQSTKYGVPWILVWYGAFIRETEAREFEQYLKSGSGKSFAYKRLVSVVLVKDFAEGRQGSPKLKA